MSNLEIELEEKWNVWCVVITKDRINVFTYLEPTTSYIPFIYIKKRVKLLKDNTFKSLDYNWQLN